MRLSPLPSRDRSSSANARGVTILHASTTVRGDVESDGVLRLDGRLEGSVLRADTVVLGAGGSISGDLHARQVVIAGAVRGNVFVSGKLEIQPTGSVMGDVRTTSVVIHEGGVVRGQIVVGPEGSDAATSDAEERRPPVTLVAKGR